MNLWRSFVIGTLKNCAIAEEPRSRTLAWRHAGFSAHNEVRVAREDIEGRKKLAGFMRL